jgi:hypothetical protein
MHHPSPYCAEIISRSLLIFKGIGLTCHKNSSTTKYRGHQSKPVEKCGTDIRRTSKKILEQKSHLVSLRALSPYILGYIDGGIPPNWTWCRHQGYHQGFDVLQPHETSHTCSISPPNWHVAACYGITSTRALHGRLTHSLTPIQCDSSTGFSIWGRSSRVLSTQPTQQLTTAVVLMGIGEYRVFRQLQVFAEGRSSPLSRCIEMTVRADILSCR